MQIPVIRSRVTQSHRASFASAAEPRANHVALIRRINKRADSAIFSALSVTAVETAEQLRAKGAYVTRVLFIPRPRGPLFAD